MPRYREVGTNFKKFTCVSCGKEVTRRTSFAINTLVDGYRTGSTPQKKLYLSKEVGKRMITRKPLCERVCKGGCKNND